MECQECQKRPATFHFTQLINGNKTERHVCEVCAKEKGYLTYPEEGYSLHNLLTGLFNMEHPHINNQHMMQQRKQLQCEKCHLTFSEFQRTGKFGCSQCYQTFATHINPILKRVHSGNTKHHGKIPKRQGTHLHTKRQLQSYREQLQKLVENEAFEEAAVIRDKIKVLEQKIKAGDQ